MLSMLLHGPLLSLPPLPLSNQLIEPRCKQKQLFVMTTERINDTQCSNSIPDEVSQTIDKQRVAQPQDPQVLQNPTTEPTNKTGIPPSSRPPLRPSPKRRMPTGGCPDGSTQRVRMKPPQQERSVYTSMKLDSLREKAVRYMNVIPTLTLDQLRENVLPRTLSAEQVQAVLDKIDVEAMKNSFPTINPTRSKETSSEIPRRSTATAFVESEYFLLIKDVIEQVLTIGEQVLKVPSQARVSYKPCSTSVSSERSNSARPDCNIMLAQSTSMSGSPDDAYCDFITTMEVKPKVTRKSIYDVSYNSA